MSEINLLKRRMVNLSTQGRYGPPVPDPVAEWDRRRRYLAEELLKIAVEEQYPTTFSVEEWFLKLAHASLAAAEVIYPDLEQEPVLPLADVPAAAKAGATAVMPKGD